MDHPTPLAPASLTVRSVTTRAVAVPLNFALGTSVAVIRTVPLLLVCRCASCWARHDVPFAPTTAAGWV